MNLKSLLWGILFVTVIVIAASSYIYTIRDNYDQQIDLAQFNVTEQKITNTTQTIENLSNGILGLTVNPTLGFMMPYDMVVAAWNGLKVMFSSIGTFGSIITNMGAIIEGSLGITIPSWVASIIIIAITLGVLFILFEVFLRWKLSE